MQKQEHGEAKLTSKDLKELKAKITEEAKHLVEEHTSTPSKQTSQSDNPPKDPLEGVEVEVYAHNATSTGILTPKGLEAIRKALGKN